MVLWPWVLYASHNPDAMVVNHERIHLLQIKRDGVWRFYGRYLLEYIHGRKAGLSHDEAYRNISYEQEAYTHQRDPNYLLT